MSEAEIKRPPVVDLDTVDPMMPGEPGIWIIIFGDLMVFALFFIYYAVYYRQHPEIYSAQQATLDRHIGLANTILLLTSSLLVATAVRQARLRLPTYRQYFSGAMACGLAFIVLKGLEWKQRFAAGVTIASGNFYMFYFTLSGIHLAHVVIGLGVLAFVRSRATGGRPRPIKLIEGGALFWHLVDALWVFLFPLLYLARS